MDTTGVLRHGILIIAALVLTASLALPGCGGSSSDTDGPNSAGPSITSVMPLPVWMEVKVGDRVRITGTGFGSIQGTSSISIGGMPVSSVISWSDTEIIATVPNGATTGAVTVTVTGVTSSPGNIVVLWEQGNPFNVAISTAANEQIAPQLISDGSGGAIITWHDLRSGTNNIYAQRVNSAGVVQWTVDGVAISTAANHQIFPQLISDGSGGAIITWMDEQNGTYNWDIYAQRVNSAGVVQWTVDGVAISTAANIQIAPQLISDGSGGAIITWPDDRSGGSMYTDIYAQRVNSTGVVLWTTNGVAISTATNVQETPQLISDGSGGAIITWHDTRSGGDIYAQRVNSAGVVQWTVDGVGISTEANNQMSPQLISDGSDGAIITWQDPRSGTNNIYAQRVNSTGVGLWTTNGVAISTAASNQEKPQLISDGAGGAIITWQDGRGGSWHDIYAQRVNSVGVVQWTADGVAISTEANHQTAPQLISDGSGGAIITWQDLRSGTIWDIYVQRLNDVGVVQWTADGVAISTAANDQAAPRLISNGSGGAIITWEDNRSGSNDIYAQGISASGRQ